MAEGIQPIDAVRRSFVYRRLTAAGASFAERAGAAVARDFGDPAREAETARRLGLADLSPLPRTGFKGPGTAEWLAGQGLVVPAEINRAAPQDGGGLAVRLAPGEVLVLAPLDGSDSLTARLDRAWAAELVPPERPRGFPVPRADSHAWFRVVGSQAAALFAKLCAVDLRPQKFDDLAVAQTSVARLSAVVIRDDLGPGTPANLAFHLLFDSASAAYCWDCLVDAMAEFDGTPVGLSALEAFVEG
jgi:sarcosine oxidase subunit gamma